MKIVSENIKNALKQSTTQRKGRILVNDTYYEVYNVEYYADVYDEGNVVGNAIASQLDFDMPYIEKFDSFKYFDGVWTGEEYEYVDMGTFTVFDEQDEDEFNKHITAFDNLIKFNVPFVDKLDYPKTLFTELQNICEQAGVELINENIANGNFEIENNQFVGGENLKSVLKAICQMSGTYAIIKDDKLLLHLKNQTDEIINKNHHEPITWKRRTYGINQVVLGMSDVEGEYVLKQDEEDIAINGVHKLVLNDNPFAYTQEKRELLINDLFEQVKGFGYVPYDANMEWLNYLELGDKIVIDGIETIVLRINGKSPNSLESVMSAPAIIDSAIQYVANTETIQNQLRRTELSVDKQNGTVNALVSTQDDLTNRVSTNELNISAQETTIKIMSENIDLETGDIQSVKTTTGYTFDEEGLKISKSENGFNSLHNNVGTYYKDGDTILSQTTKDGTIIKDMVLYGRYYYGIDENLNVAEFNKNDAMFVAEKYVDDNYEEGFGHFYNGGE